MCLWGKGKGKGKESVQWMYWVSEGAVDQEHAGPSIMVHGVSLKADICHFFTVHHWGITQVYMYTTAYS